MRLEPATVLPPPLFGSLILHSPGPSAPLSEDVSLAACGYALGPWSGLINSSSPWAEGEGIARSDWLDRFLLGLHWAAGTLTSITAQLCSVKRGKSRKTLRVFFPPITSSDCVLLWSTKPSFRGHTISEVVTFMFYILIWVMLILFFNIFLLLNWQFKSPVALKACI